MSTICIFGDSITEGYNDYEEGGWANKLKKYIEEKNEDANVYNLGISGDNTNDLLERFEVEARSREPKIIIFAIGTNDAVFIKSKNEQYVSIEYFKDNIEALKQKAEAFAKKIIFIGLTMVDENKTVPIPWATDFYHKNEYVKEYNKAIKDLCKKNNLLFMDMYDLLDKDDLDDGLHPNSKGHEKMFQRVKNFLIKNKII